MFMLTACECVLVSVCAGESEWGGVGCSMFGHAFSANG